MSNVLNSPMILAIIFPAITALGTVPLLRWAVGGEKRDVFASLGIGLACLIALVCTYGRPGEPFQFGTAAMVYAIGGVSLLSLFSTAYVTVSGLRRGLGVLIFLGWLWVVIGVPVSFEGFFEAALAAGVLFLFGLLFSYPVQKAVVESEDVGSPVISILITCLTLFVFALQIGDLNAQTFAIALFVVSISSLFLLIPRFGMVLRENALFPLSLCVAGLAWDMWMQGDVPLAALCCLSLVFFTRAAREKLLAGSPQWLGRLRHVVYGGLCLLPAGLSIVFFDVFRNL